MVKKSEINKKGRLAKSTLSVVLAASMVLTSSSFVWAAPAEEAADIVVVEEGETEVTSSGTEEAQVLTTEATEVETETDTENVGVAEKWDAEIIYPTGTTEYTFTGRAIIPSLQFKDTNGNVKKLERNKDYTLNLTDNINAGTATVVITFRNDLNVETIEKTFEIGKANISSAVVKYKANDGFTYNGKVQRPEIASATISLEGENADDYVLKEGEDFTVEAATHDKGKLYDLTSAGTQNILLKATDGGNFTGNTDNLKGYKIDKAQFDTSTIDITSRDVEYVKGMTSVPADVTVRDAVTKAELVENRDFVIWYENDKGNFLQGNKANVDIGNHRIKIVFIGDGDVKNGSNGNFVTSDCAKYTPSSSITTSYNIVKEWSLATYAEDAKLYFDENRIEGNSIPNNTYTYNGEAQGVKAISIDGLEYSKDESKTDFTVEFPVWEDCVDVGAYEVKLTGKNRFAGQTATVKLNIAPMTLNTSNVSKGVDADGNVTGNLDKKVSMRATLGTTHNNYEAANATVVINYTNPNGKEFVLEQGKDYTYTTDKTTGRVTITGIGNYSTVSNKGTTFTTKYAKIKTLDLSDSTISATVNGTYAYTGTEIKPADKDIVLIENGYQLASGTDFIVTKYYDNVKAGTASIVLQGVEKRGYSGTRVVTFKISGTAISDTYTFKAIDDITYDGKSHKAEFDGVLPLVMVNKTTGTAAPTNVINNVTLKYYRGDKETIDFVTPGTVTVVGTVKSGYTTLEGTLSTSYKIVGKPINSIAKVEAIADQEYTGEALTPEVKVVFKDGGKALVKDTDYTVTYSANTNLGTATVIVKGIGYYSGELVATFKIVGQMPQNFEFLAAQVRDIKNRTLASKATTVKYNVDPKTTVTYSSSDEKVFTVDAATGAIKYTGVGTATLTATAAESDTYKSETKTMTVRVVPSTPSKVRVTSTAAKKITVKAAKVPEAVYYQIKIWKEGRKAVFVNVKNVGDLSKVYTTKSTGTFNVQVRTFMYPGSKVADNYLSKFSSTHTVIVK